MVRNFAISGAIATLSTCRILPMKPLSSGSCNGARCHILDVNPLPSLAVQSKAVYAPALLKASRSPALPSRPELEAVMKLSATPTRGATSTGELATAVAAAAKPTAAAAAFKPGALSPAPAAATNSTAGGQPQLLAALEAANARRAASGAATAASVIATASHAASGAASKVDLLNPSSATGSAKAVNSGPPEVPQAAAATATAALVELGARRSLLGALSPRHASPAGSPLLAAQRVLISVTLEDSKRRNSLSPARRAANPASPVSLSQGASADAGGSLVSGESREGDPSGDASHVAESGTLACGQPVKRKRGRPRKLVSPQEPESAPDSPPLKRRCASKSERLLMSLSAACLCL